MKPREVAFLCLFWLFFFSLETSAGSKDFKPLRFVALIDLREVSKAVLEAQDGEG